MNIRRGNQRRRRLRYRAPSFEDTSLRVRTWLAERRGALERKTARFRERSAASERALPKPVEWLENHRLIAIAGALLLLAIAAMQLEVFRAFGGYLAAPEALPRFWIFALGLFGSWGIAVMSAPFVDRFLDRDANDAAEPAATYPTADAETDVLEADLYPEQDDDPVTVVTEPVVTAEAPVPPSRPAAPRPRAPRTPPPEPRLSRHVLKQTPLCPTCHNPLAMAIRREPGLGLMRVLRCQTCGDDRISHPGDLGAPRHDESTSPDGQTPRAPARGGAEAPPPAPRREPSPFRLIGDSDSAPAGHKRES